MGFNLTSIHGVVLYESGYNGLKRALFLILIECCECKASGLIFEWKM